MFRLFLLIFLCLGLSRAEADEVSSNRLITEAVPAWRKLKAAEEHGTFTVRERKWVTEKGQTLDHASRASRKRLVRDGPSFLLSYIAEGPAGEAHFGANPRYVFHVDRRAPAEPYVLRSLELDTTGKAPAALKRQIVSFLTIARSRLFASIPLEELITDPGFQLKGIEEVSVDGLKCLKVNFAGALTNHKQTFLDSWVILDPKRDWCILKSEAAIAKFKLITENEYWPESGGVSWLRRCKMMNLFPVEQVEEHTDHLIDKVDQAAVPASTFLLSSFGMPEPDRPIRSDYQGKIHYWLIGGAIVLFAAAYLIRRRSYRRA